jgi:hypothetical protein
MNHENKPLPRQNTPTNLTGLDPPVWYSELKIEKKKKASRDAWGFCFFALHFVAAHQRLAPANG